MYNSKETRQISMVNNPIFPFNIERLVGETDEEYEAFCKGFKTSYDMFNAGCRNNHNPNHFEEDEDECCHSELPFNDFECDEDYDIEDDTCPCYQAGWSNGYDAAHDDIYDNILLDAVKIVRLRDIKLQAIKLMGVVNECDEGIVDDLVNDIGDLMKDFIMQEVYKQLEEKGFI